MSKSLQPLTSHRPSEQLLQPPPQSKTVEDEALVAIWKNHLHGLLLDSGKDFGFKKLLDKDSSAAKIQEFLGNVPSFFTRKTISINNSSNGYKFHIVPGVINRFRGVVELDLSYNKLVVIPDWIGGFTELNSLFASSNQLETLPEAICNLKLENLLVYSNKIKKLPENFYKINSLRKLDLRGNCFDAFPIQILALWNLKTLEISGNKMNQLPSEIGQLTSLTELDTSLNGLGQLPDTICNLTALKTLKLNGNGLTGLPANLSQLQQLDTLEISSNRIIIIPPCLFELKKTGIDLTYNLIATLPQNCSSPPENIDLTSNPITMTEEEAEEHI